MIRNILKSICYISLVFVLLSSTASANTDFHEYKEMIHNNPDIFQPRTSGLIVVSNSANFESNNVIRAFTIQDEEYFNIYDLNGNIEVVKVSSLHAYECHVFWADLPIPNSLDTSGSLSSNWNEFEA